MSENELVVGVPTFSQSLYTLYVAASLTGVHCRFIVVVLTVVTAKSVTWAGAIVSTVKAQVFVGGVCQGCLLLLRILGEILQIDQLSGKKLLHH